MLYIYYKISIDKKIYLLSTENQKITNLFIQIQTVLRRNTCAKLVYVSANGKDVTLRKIVTMVTTRSIVVLIFNKHYANIHIGF